MYYLNQAPGLIARKMDQLTRKEEYRRIGGCLSGRLTPVSWDQKQKGDLLDKNLNSENDENKWGKMPHGRLAPQSGGKILCVVSLVILVNKMQKRF